ncbi:MAG TPA: hypothetical protein VLE97_01025 [Gaiellaceae bacterium]|nr:hypothetical protein [Gaiellaceae bacterium]
MRFAIGRKPVETDDLRATFAGSIHIAEEEWPDRGAKVRVTEARGVVTGFAFKRGKEGWIASVTIQIQSGMLEIVPDAQMRLAVDAETGEIVE